MFNWNLNINYISGLGLLEYFQQPVTLKIGETIEINLADPNEYNRGTVFQILHNVEGKRHNI